MLNNNNNSPTLMFILHKTLSYNILLPEYSVLVSIPTLEDVPADSTGGGWQLHTTTALEIYILYVCWPGLIILSNAGEDPSLSRALNGSSR